MALTLERIIDKIEQQWPLYVGVGVGGYIVYRILEGLGQKEKARKSSAGIGQMGGSGGSAENAQGVNIRGP